MTIRPFHLAFPVHDLDTARAFWGEMMGCPEGQQVLAQLSPEQATYLLSL